MQMVRVFDLRPGDIGGPVERFFSAAQADEACRIEPHRYRRKLPPGVHLGRDDAWMKSSPRLLEIKRQEDEVEAARIMSAAVVARSYIGERDAKAAPERERRARRDAMCDAADRAEQERRRSLGFY
jgi:hypothetical protein